MTDQAPVDLDPPHGWVTPRFDGAKARCGGPGLGCRVCLAEEQEQEMSDSDGAR